MQTVPRLYNTFQPSHYDLSLTLNRDKRIFNGTVLITGDLLLSDTSIFVHTKDLTITSAQIDGIDVETHLTDDSLELIPAVDSPLMSGIHDVTIEFYSAITDGMHGLYPCYYEHDGVKKELLATQFESHHAREVFPCVDEPEAKATFDLTLHTEAGVSVLGNMPVASQQPNETGLTTVFETSPRMSPYLLAFVVGELQTKTAKTSNGTDVTIYATHAQPASSLDFGLTTAVKAIEFFNDYFGVPYPLPKCDHVALPDFSSGAMENWGLITYREICLLADASTAISTKEYVATVITHETSHQWFGNLVTMKWWNDLWLNESFATLMEYTAVDSIYPKWDTWMTFATQETLSALRRDYLPGVQAVKTEVNHPDEISSLFDPSIVYAKGARLLKMLHAFIGEDAFRAGLRQYFTDHAYKNTEGSDLWAAFSKTSGKDVGAFMKSWLEQPGMPVVTVTTTDDGYSLAQKRFLVGESEADHSLWPIPLTATNPDFPALLTTETATVVSKDSTTLYLNKGNSAHFVAAYDAPIYGALTEAIRAGEIEEIDRLAILHETSLLARGGVSTATALFQLLAAYQTERQEPVWDIIGRVIADLKRFVQEDEDAEKMFKAYVTTLALPLYNVLGWEKLPDETESDTKLRSTILGLLSYGEHQPVIDHGLSLFHGALHLDKLDGELRGNIFGIAAKYGDDYDRDRLFSLYQDSHIGEIQQDALSGLTITKDPVMLKKMIASITNESIVRPQDVDRWFIYLISNRYSRDDAWKWMVSHWSWITETFGGDKSYDSFPRYAASALSTRAYKVAYDEFFSPLKDQPALTRAIDLGSKDIEGRVAWIERDYTELLAALKLDM
ncbi:M1 family metallopeptidase [Pedobacter sp.]|nr:M1 family metallopeptidase [Candidatus Saccharibacteria bacterium]